jgi:hypothetical protein
MWEKYENNKIVPAPVNAAWDWFRNSSTGRKLFGEPELEREYRDKMGLGHDASIMDVTLGNPAFIFGPGAETKAGKALMGYFVGQSLKNKPEQVRSLKEAMDLGDEQRAKDEVLKLVADLAMAGTTFEIRFNQSELGPDSWSERGIDQAEFFLSPNPGEDLRPLARIVSGGELSRVMLALKTMSVDEAEHKTMVFDEVDAGIGGRVADVVGARLGGLGDRFQVLCITHLPQIAARASTHFRIDKAVRRDRTVTTVQRLDLNGRIEEIGRMIGGASVTESVRASARELLSASKGNRGDSVNPPRLSGHAKGKQKAKGESESRRRV